MSLVHVLRPVVWLFGISLLMMCVGCSGGATGPKTIPASGKVTYKGEPVKSGSLAFAPADPKTSRATQAIIVEGEYKTEPGKGLMVGEYKVTVQALKNSVAELDPKDAAKQGIDNNAVPKKYMDLKTTDLEVTISDGDKEIKQDFELTD